MSSNTHPKITIRKINQTGGQSLLSPQIVAVNQRLSRASSSSSSTSSPATSTLSTVQPLTGAGAISNQPFCYLVPAQSASILRAVSPAGLVGTPTTIIQTANQVNIPPNFRPVNNPISIRFGDRSGLVRAPGISTVFNPQLNVTQKVVRMPSIDNKQISISAAQETSLLASADNNTKVFTIIKNKRAKKIPNKYKEESLLQQPPAKMPKTPRAPKTPKRTPKTPKAPGDEKPKVSRGRKRKLESLLMDPNEASTPKEAKRKGRKPKIPEVTPGMKKTKSRSLSRISSKDKKNRTSLVPLSRISQIMRSVPSLTTLKPDAIAVAVHAAELFMKSMIEKTSENSENPAVLKLQTFQEYLDKSSLNFLKPYAPAKIKAVDALAKQKAFVETQNAKRLGLHLQNGEDEEEEEEEEEADEEEDEEEEGENGNEENDDDDDDNEQEENDNNEGNSEGNEQNDDDEEDDDEAEDGEEDDDDDEEEVEDGGSIEEDDDNDNEEDDDDEDGDNDEDDDDDNEDDEGEEDED